LISIKVNAILKNMAETKKEKFDLNVEEMLKAGLHFGHRISKLHPKMKPFIYGIKSTVHIIDLEKTVQYFKKALEFIQELAKEKKVLLFVGTKIQHKKLVEDIAKELKMPYVTERWLGGTLTNFQVMKERIEHLRELEEMKNSEEFGHYTKKERAKIEKEISDLEKKFGGIRELEDLPDAIFICDMRQDSLAAKEAHKKEIPVIAICDTNVDPSLVDFPIPANDDAISSVKYILEKVKEVIKSQRSKVKDQKS